MLEKCYLCGATENLTDDHVPPENLFPKPKPTNLITIKCCYDCNQSYKLLDERFRIYVSIHKDRSQAGERIWKNKVVASSFGRSWKLKESIRQSGRESVIDPVTGNISMEYLFSMEDIERYLTRVTKGLMAYFYPQLDYTNSEFRCTSPRLDSYLKNFLSDLRYDKRGEDVFEFWRVLASEQGPEDSPTESLWFYRFYSGDIFMVEVD